MLEHIFGSKTRLKLLYLFFSFPERAFFGRELARQTEMQLNAVRRELMNLEKIGLIRQVTASEAKNEEPGTERSKFYALDKSFALYEELKALLLKAHLYAEQELIDRLKTKSGSVRLLILSGFFSGELDAPTDILIVGSLKPMVVARIIRDLEAYDNLVPVCFDPSQPSTINPQPHHESIEP